MKSDAHRWAIGPRRNGLRNADMHLNVHAAKAELLLLKVPFETEENIA